MPVDPSWLEAVKVVPVNGWHQTSFSSYSLSHEVPLADTVPFSIPSRGRATPHWDVQIPHGVRSGARVTERSPGLPRHACVAVSLMRVGQFAETMRARIVSADTTSGAVSRDFRREEPETTETIERIVAASTCVRPASGSFES